MRFLSSRSSVVFVHDLFVAAVSFFLAVWIRFGSVSEASSSHEALSTGFIVFMPLCTFVFWWQGLHRGVWRYVSLRDLGLIIRTVTISLVLYVSVLFLLARLEDFPRSLPVLLWFVLIVSLGGSRFAYRVLRDQNFLRSFKSSGTSERMPVLLIGAGTRADLFIRATEGPLDSEYRVIGLVSTHGQRVGRLIRNCEVLGTIDDVRSVFEVVKGQGHRLKKVIVTDDTLVPNILKELFAEVDRAGLSLARLPPVDDVREGLEDKISLRPIVIEDLLGRPQASLDRTSMERLVSGQCVLVTGAGGSIGGEIARQVAALGPRFLILTDHSEYALYSIDMEVGEQYPHVKRSARIMDVRDRKRVTSLFSAYRPDVVLHAAALKHVPLVEENPLEGIKTNVFGTSLIARACVDYSVSIMVLISTDKAVNPTNVMGATKRLAENVCQVFDVECADSQSTRFVTVRFGNVLGSTGSVIPLFRRQLESGGPLTVTHPEMTRYFMTICEAVELVLEASSVGWRDDLYRGKIFVLDMGEPVRIVDLAEQMIRLAGLVPNKDVNIVFTGSRPGEKLFEEIFHGEEPPEATTFPGLLIASPRPVDTDGIQSFLMRIETGCTPEWALGSLRQLVPEYASSPPRIEVEQRKDTFCESHIIPS